MYNVFACLAITIILKIPVIMITCSEAFNKVWNPSNQPCQKWRAKANCMSEWGSAYQDILQIRPLQNGLHRSKDLVLGNCVAVVNIAEHCWCDVVPLVTCNSTKAWCVQ